MSKAVNSSAVEMISQRHDYRSCRQDGSCNGPPQSACRDLPDVVGEVFGSTTKCPLHTVGQVGEEFIVVGVLDHDLRVDGHVGIHADGFEEAALVQAVVGLGNHLVNEQRRDLAHDRDIP